MDEDLNWDALMSELTDPTLEETPTDLPDEAGDAPPEESAIPEGPACEVCGTSIPWAGRGRKPKYCVDHKSRTAGAKKAISRGSKTSSAALRKDLTDDLTREMAMFGVGMSKIMPTTGATIFKRAERTATALVKLAGDNPRLLGALELTAKAASAIDLAEAGTAIGIAAMVDLGKMNPDAIMPQMLGVTEIWHEINDEPLTNEEQVAAATEQRVTQSVFEVPVPKRFEAIT